MRNRKSHQMSALTRPTQLLGHVQGGGTLGLVQLGHHCVRRMRDDGAEHAGNVTGGEGHHQLLTLGAIGTWLGHHILVQQLQRPLEAGELHHGVWDLAHPQWHQALVEGGHALLGGHLGQSLAQCLGESGRGLDLDLGRLHGRQGDIGEELSGCRCSQIESGSVEECVLLADSIAVHLLEDLVQAELAQTLHRVADEGGCPSLGQSADALLSQADAEAGEHALVLGRVHLQAALDQIQGHHHGVCGAARDDAAQAAQQEVVVRAEFAGVCRGINNTYISNSLVIPGGLVPLTTLGNGSGSDVVVSSQLAWSNILEGGGHHRGGCGGGSGRG